MSPHEFLTKWRHVELKERSASQSHFNDLCALLDVPNPVLADPTGEWFTFEKGPANREEAKDGQTYGAAVALAGSIRESTRTLTMPIISCCNMPLR